jgi:hypothetical protein
LYLLRGMAAGDVKLMAMVGAFAGPLPALQIGRAGGAGGGVIALLMLLCALGCAAGGQRGRHAYGVAIALGTLVLWRGGIIEQCLLHVNVGKAWLAKLDSTPKQVSCGDNDAALEPPSPYTQLLDAEPEALLPPQPKSVRDSGLPQR